MSDQASTDRFDAMITTDKAEADRYAEVLTASGLDVSVIQDAGNVFHVSVRVKP